MGTEFFFSEPQVLDVTVTAYGVIASTSREFRGVWPYSGNRERIRMLHGAPGVLIYYEIREIRESKQDLRCISRIFALFACFHAVKVSDFCVNACE